MPFGLRVPDPVGLFTDTILGSGRPVVPSLIITELTGEQRTIELRGRAKPYRGVGFGVRQRTKLVWYQGNPVGTQQILGPELEPTHMEGMWKDRFMSGAEADNASAILVNGSPEIRTAEAAVALFYSVARAASQLRVVWGPEVRFGILTAFVPEYERRQDVRWTMDFEWKSRGESQVRVIDDPATAGDVLNEINSLDDLLGFSPEDMAVAFNAQLLDTVDSVRDTVGNLFEVLRAANAVVSIPRSVIGKIESTVESIRLELTEEIARLTESSVLGSSGGTSGASATGRASAALRVEAYRRGVAAQASALRAVAQEAGRQQAARAKPEEYLTVTLPADSSLYSLSVKYYGTPDYANFLARANGLTTALAPAGTLLRVPTQPPEGADQAPACCGC